MSNNDSPLSKDFEPVFTQCNTCKHFYRENADISCKAFEKIPMSILTNKIKHDKPIEGQENKVVHEKAR